MSCVRVTQRHCRSKAETSELVSMPNEIQRKRILRGIAPLVSLTVLLAGCSGATPAAEATSATGHTAGTQSSHGAASAGADAELAKFTAQTLDFTGCEPGVADPTKVASECAMLKVPLDYANPAGTVIELGVLRVVATGSDPIGSLVVNPGGPGGAGTEFAVQVAQAWGNNSARERFDLIGLDPRGVGESRPTIDWALVTL